MNYYRGWFLEPLNDGVKAVKHRKQNQTIIAESEKQLKELIDDLEYREGKKND